MVVAPLSERDLALECLCEAVSRLYMRGALVPSDAARSPEERENLEYAILKMVRDMRSGEVDRALEEMRTPAPLKEARRAVYAFKDFIDREAKGWPEAKTRVLREALDLSLAKLRKIEDEQE